MTSIILAAIFGFILASLLWYFILFLLAKKEMHEATETCKNKLIDLQEVSDSPNNFFYKEFYENNTLKESNLLEVRKKTSEFKILIELIDGAIGEISFIKSLTTSPVK